MTILELHQESCSRKTKYVDEATVMQVLSDQLGHRRVPHRSNKNLGIYICRVCGYMHIGHKGKRTKQALKAETSCLSKAF